MSHNHFDTQSNIEAPGSRLWKWIIGGLGTLLVLGILFLTLGNRPLPPQDSSTQTSSSGYIPEVGLVDTSSPIRVLRQPVTVERNPITVGVVQSTVDSERVVLLLEVSGFFPAGEREEIPVCEGTPKLRLPDGGVLLTAEGGGHIWDSTDGYSYRIVFPTLPPDMDAATLEIPCLLAIQPGDWPQNWQIPLEFEVAEDLEVAPVVEIPDQVSSEILEPASLLENGKGQQEDQFPSDTEPNATSGLQNPDFGIELTLDHYVELESGYALMGKVAWASLGISDFGVMYGEMILTDANGAQIPNNIIQPMTFPEPGENWVPWAVQIDGKNYEWPLTLSLDAVSVDIDLSDPITFQFNPGDDPQSDQTWNLNQELQVGNYHLEVLSAQVEEIDHHFGYKFRMQSQDKIVAARVIDFQNPIMGSGGGGTPTEGPFTTEILYEGELPNGSITVSITDLTILSRGPWQVNWAP